MYMYMHIYSVKVYREQVGQGQIFIAAFSLLGLLKRAFCIIRTSFLCIGKTS